MNKKQIFRGQALVEYALLLTLMVVPLLVIFSALGDTASAVWEVVVDSVQSEPLFDVHLPGLTYTPHTATVFTSTPLITDTPNPAYSPTPSSTATDYIPPTETLTATDYIPPTETLTATEWFPPTATSTNTEIPTETEVPADTPTSTIVPSPTSSYKAVTSVTTRRRTSQPTQIAITFVTNQNITLTITDYQSMQVSTVQCNYNCTKNLTVGDSSAYVGITSSKGDNINILYPAKN
jgi:hypothetical protein